MNLSFKNALAYLTLSSCAIGLQAQAQTPTSPTSDAIVVTGKRAEVVNRIDRKIYRADRDMQSSTGTAADVLNSVPSVDVDADGNISLRGNSQVTVLIDGKPSSQVSGASGGDGLQQIPAGDIDRIEVITNPSAQFKPDGSGGVINIILKKSRKQGLTGSLQASLGNSGRYSTSASLAINKDKIGFSAAVAFKQDDKVRRILVDRTSLDAATQRFVHTRHDLTEHVRRQLPSVKTSIDYAMTAQDKLGATLSWGERVGDRYFLQKDVVTDDNGSLSKLSERKSVGYEWRLDALQGVNFEHQFDTDGERIRVNLQRSTTREREKYQYTNSYTLPVQSDTHDSLNLGLDLITTDLSADYVLPLSGDRTLSLGYDYQRDDNAYDNFGASEDRLTGFDVLNPDITNHFRYYQAILAAYGTYQTKIGHIDVLAGLRFEQVTVRTHQITGNQTSQHRYSRAYPTLHLSSALSEAQKLTASYSVRVSRPDPEELNPFSDHQDTRNLRAGNPDLKPQETQSFEAGYSYDGITDNYSITGYWRDSRNTISEITKVISDDVILVTKTNLPRSRSGGIEFTHGGKLNAQLSYATSGNFFYNEIDTAPFGSSGVRSGLTGNVKTSLDIRASPVDTFQLSGSYNGKSLTAQGYQLPIFLVNLGYKHQIRDNLSLVFTTSDALNGQKFRRITNTASLQDRYERRQNGRIVFVNLTYSLAGTKKSKANGFDYDQ